jgi:hypothetical protein
MNLYELPGRLINPESIVLVNTDNEQGYILHTANGGEYHLTAEQTEALKKLVGKESKNPETTDKGESAGEKEAKDSKDKSGK